MMATCFRQLCVIQLRSNKCLPQELEDNYREGLE
jgi:hypothetical protein